MEGVGLASTMLSSLEGGYFRVRKVGREATLGKPRVRINEDQTYKGLGDTVPPHSRAFSTAPSACSALRAFNGCCNKIQLNGAFRHLVGLSRRRGRESGRKR